MPPVAYYSCADTPKEHWATCIATPFMIFLKCILLDGLQLRTLFMHKCCQLQLRHPALLVNLIVCMQVPNHI